MADELFPSFAAVAEPIRAAYRAHYAAIVARLQTSVLSGGTTVTFGANGEIVYDLAAKCRLPSGTEIVRENCETLITVPCAGHPSNGNLQGTATVDNYGGVLLTFGERSKWYFIRGVSPIQPELAAAICQAVSKIVENRPVAFAVKPAWLPTSTPTHYYKDVARPCIGDSCQTSGPLSFMAENDQCPMASYRAAFNHAAIDGFHLFKTARTAIVGDVAFERRLPSSRLPELDQMRCEAVEDMLKALIAGTMSLEAFETWVALVGDSVKGPDTSAPSPKQAAQQPTADRLVTRIQAERARQVEAMSTVISGLTASRDNAEATLLKELEAKAQLEEKLGAVVKAHGDEVAKLRYERAELITAHAAQLATVRREANEAMARAKANEDAALAARDVADRLADAEAALAGERAKVRTLIGETARDTKALQAALDNERAASVRAAADVAQYAAKCDQTAEKLSKAEDEVARLKVGNEALSRTVRELSEAEPRSLAISTLSATNEKLEAELANARAALSDAESRIRDLSEMLERIKKAAAAVGALGDASSALQRSTPPHPGALRAARLAAQTPGKM